MSVIATDEVDWLVYEGQRAVITEKGLAYLAELDRRNAEARERAVHRGVRITRKGRKVLRALDKLRAGTK